MVLGFSPDSSTTSTLPDLTTKNLKSLSPASKSFSPSRNRLSNVRGHRPGWHLGFVELGKGDGVQVVLGHAFVDADEAIRRSAHHLLGCQGASVETGRDANEAIALMRKHLIRPPWSISACRTSMVTKRSKNSVKSSQTYQSS